MKILVTGASGLLGVNFCLATADEHDVLGVYQSNPIFPSNFRALKADLTKNNELENILDQFQPDLIVHCAAMANLEHCKKHPEQAYLVNTILPGEIAKLTSGTNCKLIAISTDTVFDGTIGNHKEDDIPSPISVYGKTKLAGERLVLQTDSNAIIPRVNFFGCSLSGKRSLAEFFVTNLTNKKQIKGFKDVIFSPLYVRHLIKILLIMVNKNLAGLYHVVNNEQISKFDFGVQIANIFGLDSNLISPVSISEGNLLAKRSNNLTLNIEKLSNALSKPIPSIYDGITDLFSDYKNNQLLSLLRQESKSIGDINGI